MKKALNSARNQAAEMGVQGPKALLAVVLVEQVLQHHPRTNRVPHSLPDDPVQYLHARSIAQAPASGYRLARRQPRPERPWPEIRIFQCSGMNTVRVATCAPACPIAICRPPDCLVYSIREAMNPFFA